MMKDLQFDRIAQIIAIAAIDGNKSISTFFVKGELRIKFSEYVKSQVHLNVVHGLFNRSLKDYVETLYFLQGKSSNRTAALRVLQYFYDDLANFLINNGEEIYLTVEVDTDLFKLPKVEYSIKELRDELLNGFDEVLCGGKEINGWKFATVLDYAKNADDIKAKAGSYAIAWFLKSQNANLNVIGGKC